MATLEEALDFAFAELDVLPNNQASVKNFLNMLKEKDLSTYEHSVRVGLLGVKVARHMHLDPKVFLFAGALHDIGKIMIDPEVLKKTGSFSDSDMEEMRKHPEYTYNLLHGVHDFSAEVALRHHKFQEEGYPETLPRPPFSPNTRVMIDYFARLLSLVDFYDAITSRMNEKFGAGKGLSREEVKSIVLMKNPDQRYLIEDLYNNGIFGAEEGMPTTPIQDMLYGDIWKDWDGKRNPQETRRYVTLACALEPLPDKAGCTTRGTDISRHLKLEYFITAAINVGDAFEELAEMLSRGQPRVIYHLARKAQVDCAKNRGGGRINQGMLEMLVPIVASQILFDPNYQLKVEEILEKAKGVMKSTSREDVEELIKMKRIAYDLSAYHEREVPAHPDAATVYDYYALDLENSSNQTGIAHNREFVSGFQTIKQMYYSIMESKQKSFEGKVEEAYSAARGGVQRGTGKGLTADCIACAIYLALSMHPKEKIIV